MIERDRKRERFQIGSKKESSSILLVKKKTVALAKGCHVSLVRKITKLSLKFN